MKFIVFHAKCILIAIIISCFIALLGSIIITHSSLTEPSFQCFPKNESEETLVFVQVVFRHGERTIEAGTTYKNDPYLNYSFYPENYGELITKGKLRMYKLGQDLRRRYNAFLGIEYNTNIVKSFVSNYDRTQMSLQCVHAGLFPRLIGGKLGVPWRPITYTSFEVDTVLGIAATCKNLVLPEDKPSDDETIELFKYISEKAGIVVDTYFHAMPIINNFHVEIASGLEIPDWGKEVYPQLIRKTSAMAWTRFIKNNERIGVGGLLRLVTKEALAKIQQIDEHQVNGMLFRKINLYSGHDYNIYFLLNAFIWDDFEMLNFGSYITFELHRINGVYGFKIYHDNHQPHDPRLLNPSFCDNGFCPMDTFIANTQWYYNPPAKC